HGTIGWFCLPDYDGAPLFGALLDAHKGGFWRLGPAHPTFGKQHYWKDSAVLVTRWTTPRGELELTHAMAWPEDERGRQREPRRVLLRRLRCTNGQAECRLEFWPRYDFEQPATVSGDETGLSVQAGDHNLAFWTDAAFETQEHGASGAFRLKEGDECWAILTLDERPAAWSASWANQVLEQSNGYWQEWLERITYTGPRSKQVRRSALTIHLLSYAPKSSLVAAPTTSLPERIRGERNYDYRYAWVRDASLSIAILSLLGDTGSAKRYMDWLAQLGSSNEMLLQVVYRINGGTDLTQQKRWAPSGYRGSRPLHIGNHAYKQRQLDSLGYLADCMWIYLEQGGEWKDAYWRLVERIAAYTAATWQQPDHSIWELSTKAQYVSSKAMAWVTLERTVHIAEHLCQPAPVDNWRAEMERIHAEVMEQGWSEKQGAFRQRYGSEHLDAAALLIPIMGFLPPDHPRVLSTVERIAEALTIEDFVYRYHPIKAEGHPDVPLPDLEGAFLPCTFWLAAVYAMIDQPDAAEKILQAAEAVAGEVGLFAEEVDARDKQFLGNSPLLFSQAEYVRAIMELAKVRPVDKARLAVGKVAQKLDDLFPAKGS
ncbi:MAG: glycoside hydrolase family 15 protein, partial [Chloroflexota bacterium]|nr:glycoside hydrolase family 15 protein [Chloroflexota bacterium]